MGFLARIRASAAGSALPAWDDYWYSRPGWSSAAGMSVTPETAMKLSAVFACIRVRSESLATCPLIVYRRIPNGGKVRAPEHPLYKVLHDKPNQWQTAVEFIEMMQAHLDLRGNAFSRIVPGPAGAIDQLVPLHPDLVQVYRLPNGRLKYQVRSRFDGEVDWFAQDEIFHIRGLSADGLVGLSPIAVQRETIGTGLGIQDYSGRFFANDARVGTFLKHPNKFRDDATREKFRENWQKSQTGENRHKTPVLEDGIELKSLNISNKDAQYLEAYINNREEVCGIYRTPPHKIGILQRATNNNIEHQGIEFVTDAIQPAATRWERRINTDLIDPISEAFGDGTDEYFAEFLVGGLLRGDMKSRYDAYAIGRNWGWLCPDTIRESEGMNPLPEGKGGQEYLRPLNMVPSGTLYLPPMSADEPDPQDPPKQKQLEPNDPPPPEAPDDEGADARARSREQAQLLKSFATEAARRVVRKEVTALRKVLSRDPVNFLAEAATFYETHQLLVSQTMSISPDAAAAYIRSNMTLLHAASGEEQASALDWIEDTAPEGLANAALGFNRAAAFSRAARVLQETSK